MSKTPQEAYAALSNNVNRLAGQQRAYAEWVQKKQLEEEERQRAKEEAIAKAKKKNWWTAIPMGIASGAASGAAVGGPFGALIGGIAGAGLGTAAGLSSKDDPVGSEQYSPVNALPGIAGAAGAIGMGIRNYNSAPPSSANLTTSNRNLPRPDLNMGSRKTSPLMQDLDPTYTPADPVMMQPQPQMSPLTYQQPVAPTSVDMKELREALNFDTKGKKKKTT